MAQKLTDLAPILKDTELRGKSKKKGHKLPPFGNNKLKKKLMERKKHGS